jgi:hypothetical protein
VICRNAVNARGVAETKSAPVLVHRILINVIARLP